MTTSMKLIAAAVLFQVVGCQTASDSAAGVPDAGFEAGEASCIVEAGPDVDPLLSCSPTGCIPFDNSVVPNVPRLQ